MKKKRIVLIVLGVVLFSVLCCVIINKLGLDDITKLRKIVNNGFSGCVIYIVLLALQTAFLPVNSLVLIVPAIVLFGSDKAFILSLIGSLIGAFICYFIGRAFGDGVLSFIFGKEKAGEFTEKFRSTHILLPVFLLIPIFPDEIMCLSAGAGKVPPLFFTITIIITRCIDLFFTCYVGASIPFTGPYLILWGILFIFLGITMYFLTKKQQKIVEFFSKNIKKTKNKKLN